LVVEKSARVYAGKAGRPEKMVRNDDGESVSRRPRRRLARVDHKCGAGKLQDHRAMVLRTNSVPRTPDRPAEHFIAVAFPQHDFIELAFRRFKLTDGIGCSCVFSHRIYGEKAGDEASAWLKANAPATEKTLMEWN
jgi:hypothetical protein